MATIAREDHVVFAIHVYRTSLPLQRRGLMMARMRALAEQHGQFVRVRRRERELDLVMSRDNGFLLGESVHEYFGRPEHMVYCEVLPGGRQVMLVVVRHGQIVRDTQLLFEDITEELRLSLVEAVPYRVYYHGKVPLLSHAEELNAVARHPLRSVQALGASVFASLPVHSEHQLQSLELALRTQFIGWRFGMWCLLLLMLMGVGYGVQQWSQPPPVPVVALPTPEDPVLKYRQFLSGPDTHAVMQNAMRYAVQAATIPGWQFTQMRWQNTRYHVLWRALTGERVFLRRWVMTLPGANWQIVDQQARLNFADSVRRQMHVPKYNSMHAWRVRLQDGLAKLRLEHRLHTRAMQQVAGVKVLAVDLQFEQAAPVEWQLLTRLLMQLPIRLEGIALKEQGGVFSGNVRFKLVGKADDSE